MTHIPYSTSPAAVGAGNPLFDLSVSLRQIMEERRKRKSLQRLLDLEDYALDDMNVERVDVEWVLTLPLSIDAGAELARLAEERRKKLF